MRKIALLAVVAFAAACGGSSDPAPTSPSITGTIGTAAFTSASQLALVASGNGCTLPTLAPGIAVGVSLAAVNVADLAGTCADSASCISNSRNLQLVIAKVHVPNVAFPDTNAPPFTPGTYQYFDIANPTGTPTIDANGNLGIFIGGVEVVGAAPTCSTTGGYGISSGTLTISTVSGSTITGSVTVNLVDGLGAAAGTLSGTFTTATNCTPSPAPSACDLLNQYIPSPGPVTVGA